MRFDEQMASGSRGVARNLGQLVRIAGEDLSLSKLFDQQLAGNVEDPSRRTAVQSDCGDHERRLRARR